MIPTASARPRFTKFIYLLLAAGVPAATALYAAYIEPAWIEVTRHSIPTKTNASPLVIAQLSDLHLRKISRTENRVLQILREIEPHLLILSGDVIESPAGFPALENFLGRLGPMEKIAVLGNWEHWGGISLARLKATYTRHRVRLLINERADLLLEKRPISVIGLDDATAGSPDINSPADGCPPNPLLLVQHSPSYFETATGPQLSPLFCLSGHTHGGQLALFGLNAWTPRGSGSFRRGWYQTPHGPLYVSRGIGTSILPLRFGARPEIAVFVVK